MQITQHKHRLYKTLLRVLVWKPQLSHMIIPMCALALLYRGESLVDHIFEIDFTKLTLAPEAQAAAETKEEEKPAEKKDEKKVSDESGKEEKPDKDLPKLEKVSDKKAVGEEEFDPLMIDDNAIKILKALSDKKKSQESIRGDAELEKREKLAQISQEKAANEIKDLEKAKEALKTTEDKLTKAEVTNIKTMSKIYESMKPAQAADICNKLEMTALTQILKNMNPKKASAIVAQMEPGKARIVTIEMLRAKDAGRNSAENEKARS